MSTMNISVFDVLAETNKNSLNEIAHYIADRNAISRFYLLERRIKELKRMRPVVLTRRYAICLEQDILLLEAVQHRLGELAIAEARKAVNNGRSQ